MSSDHLVDNYPAIRDTNEKTRLHTSTISSSKHWADFHNFKTPFPEEWKDSFDCIQLRAILANVPGDAAIDLVKRAMELLRPGGYIQIVDGSMSAGELKGDEKPHIRFFTSLANYLILNGLNNSQGARVGEILDVAGDGVLEDVETKEGKMLFGKGAGEMEDASWQWLRFMLEVQAGPAMLKAGVFASKEGLDTLRLEVMEEAQTEGFSMPWHAAWGRKTSVG
ncbi:uncharacterized protein AB675_1412 [Cyphellophora attinorum]|uniref:Methyltransferase type 11 domain-containing protein n=1 Tax=Cyphellophora attinorum TaxID=1664694 RepID=A0A0N0NH96_9EURO|nr:uncharacterized protein AB675_1412 [Phialophora attinorum]KPI34431.1 hypothetical protein AB675_1412 [Phialophora attinorum]